MNVQRKSGSGRMISESTRSAVVHLDPSRGDSLEDQIRDLEKMIRKIQVTQVFKKTNRIDDFSFGFL